MEQPPFMSYSSMPALESLHVILSDNTYFQLHGAKNLSVHMRAQLEHALEEAEESVRPVSEARLRQIILRLMMHFSSTRHNPESLLDEYCHLLAHYPEDILCAAYQHCLRTHQAHHLPTIAQLIAFMDPMVCYRKITRFKVAFLLSQVKSSHSRDNHEK